jgi:branched-chain amino acid transport system substrate-binding protein
MPGQEEKDLAQILLQRRETMKKTVTVLLIGVLSLVAFGTAGPTPAWAQEAKMVKFGIIIALSGPAATWGIPNFRSMQMGAWAINEKGGFKVGQTTYKWDPIGYDHRYVPAEAVKAANKAIYSDKVSFMCIHGGANVIGCLPLLKENNMLSLNNAGGGKAMTNPNNPLVFRHDPSIDCMYASVLPFLMQREKINTMAVTNPDDETGRSGLDAARRGAGLSNLKIVSEEFFERGTKEFTPLLTRLLAKNPDLIDTSYTDPTSATLMCKQARELGYKKVFLLSWGPDPNQVLKIAGAHSEKAYMNTAGPIEPQTPAQKEAYGRFLAKWPASEWDMNYWAHVDLFTCITKAIVETQTFDSIKLASHLENMTWDSPIGKFSFGGVKIFGIKRQLLYPITVYQMQGGKPVFMATLPVPPGVVD